MARRLFQLGLVLICAHIDLALSQPDLRAGLQSGSASRPSVAFINPDAKGQPFWALVTRFMREAAADLNIDLEVYHQDKDRFKGLKIAEALLKRTDRPDYLLYMYQSNTGKRILELAEQNGVPSFLFNTDIHPNDKQEVGQPRDRFKHWLGHMYPDDTQAGDLLATSLLNLASSTGVPQASTPIDILAFSGGLDSAVSADRNTGLKQAMARHGNAALKQLVYTQWSPTVAMKKAAVLTQRYPNVKVIWSASDAMALAIASDLADKNKYVMGGIDWTWAGLEAVEKGLLDASVGGHFLEGAWALVLLHDHHHGQDFAQNRLTFKTRMHLVTRENASLIRNKLSQDDLAKVDFSSYSRVHTDQDDYRFDVDQILQMLGL